MRSRKARTGVMLLGILLSACGLFALAGSVLYAGLLFSTVSSTADLDLVENPMVHIAVSLAIVGTGVWLMVIGDRK